MSSKSTLLKVIDILAVILLIATLGVVFLYAPLESTMGQVQRIFYFHISTAWVGLLGFIMAAICGILYLSKGNRKYDIAEMAAVEVSLIFFLIAIILGSIWAREAWNRWWVPWDPRLNTALITELFYAAYLLLRQGIDEPERRARFSAIYVILGIPFVVLTFFIIRWLGESSTLHPIVIAGKNPDAQATFNMGPKMLHTMFFSLFSFTIIFIALVCHRIRLGNLAEKIEQLRMKIMQ
jgi:heme exporter protein C